MFTTKPRRLGWGWRAHKSTCRGNDIRRRRCVWGCLKVGRNLWGNDIIKRQAFTHVVALKGSRILYCRSGNRQERRSGCRGSVSWYRVHKYSLIFRCGVSGTKAIYHPITKAASAHSWTHVQPLTRTKQAMQQCDIQPRVNKLTCKDVVR